MNKMLLSKILIMFFLFPFYVNSSQEQDLPVDQEADIDNIAEITQFLSDSEIDTVYDNPDTLYVYLEPEIIDCFENVDLPQASNFLRLMQNHIKKNKSASYEFTSKAVDEAIQYYKDKAANNFYINILEEYKAKLETGQVVILTENKTYKSFKSKNGTYECLFVKKSLKSRSLYVRRHAKICGNLCVRKDLTVNGNTTIVNTLNAFKINANSIALNGNPLIINALGLPSASSVINYNNMGLLHGGVKLNFDNDFTIYNSSNIFGSFMATPLEQYFTIGSDIGILSGNNLTGNDPLLQALEALQFICSNNPNVTFGIDPVYLFGVDLSFTVTIPNTLFTSADMPKISLSLENLPAASDPLLFQLAVPPVQQSPDQITSDQIDSQAVDPSVLQLGDEVCYSCTGLYICKSPQAEDLKDMPTRAYSNKLAAVRSVIPTVNNIYLSPTGALTFTVNLLVLIYDTEDITLDTLPNLTAIVKQFFQNAVVVFEVNGSVQDGNSAVIVSC